MARLTEALKPHQIVTEIHGHRVLVIELVPHPAKSETLRSPLALLDFKTNGWVLLFRTADGGWQPVPGDVPTLTLSRKVDQILCNADQLF